ncbi:hypothetical protein E5676_scaffold236G00850 [Cucumis melo var. makuwa]|uniref:Uncharacterized protein n=1 Tax=Cucumis melo var. makuwa TaxID=1194695 RepID=A0A5D3DUN2_CUCMM|nr:hypothetical protein E6C27_scaffold113G00180 [Cucumis melo var. makuwa]TYK27214.1 hypothetical protein E5676_scaffold236G00850 [Cucumis melo var. makuwa]
MLSGVEAKRRMDLKRCSLVKEGRQSELLLSVNGSTWKRSECNTQADKAKLAKLESMKVESGKGILNAIHTIDDRWMVEVVEATFRAGRDILSKEGSVYAGVLKLTVTEHPYLGIDLEVEECPQVPVANTTLTVREAHEHWVKANEKLEHTSWQAYLKY